MKYTWRNVSQTWHFVSDMRRKIYQPYET